MLITRVPGLEHVADRRVRQSGGRLSWKYGIYHGGFRLWEVERSIRTSDHTIVLNEEDGAYIRDNFNVPSDRVSRLPNGIAPHFAAPLRAKVHDDGTLRLAFVGSWLPRKGTDTVVRATQALIDLGVKLDLSLLGTGQSSDEVLKSFDGAVRGRIRVIPFFKNTELPSLLGDQDIMLFPSLSEGFSLALVEAMACGLVPVATPVGGVPNVIQDGRNGFIVPIGGASEVVRAVSSLAKDRTRLASMRIMAHQESHKYRWDEIASRTVGLYRAVLERQRALTSTEAPPRVGTAS